MLRKLSPLLTGGAAKIQAGWVSAEARNLPAGHAAVQMVGYGARAPNPPYDAAQLQFGIARLADGTFALTVTPRSSL